MRKISADIIYPVSSPPVHRGVILLNNEGMVKEILDRDEVEQSSLEHYSGMIVPGFVNTHCHLELSHLKGKVDSGTGLLPFLKSVVSLREVDPEEIQVAIHTQNRLMEEEGIVAVGDICNTADTLSCKSRSKIHYHSFVEMFDFMQEDWADSSFERYLKVYDTLREKFQDRVSASPHAPYTVSAKLYSKINALNSTYRTIVSIHNQETLHENQLFIDGKGGFPDFFKHFNVELNNFQPMGKGSIYHALQFLDTNHKHLMVHNTVSDYEDIVAAENHLSRAYWVTCPNANLYIENSLPNYDHFRKAGSKIAIGTDSLTSNWQLSMLEEMKTILKYKSSISFDEVLTWATLNGAEALDVSETLGSIEPDKTPGLVHIDAVNSQSINKNTKARRIA